jgi:hypothetical protein
MTEQPTEKQVDYIIRLIRGRGVSDAYRELAPDMSVSLAVAKSAPPRGTRRLRLSGCAGQEEGG